MTDPYTEAQMALHEWADESVTGDCREFVKIRAGEIVHVVTSTLALAAKTASMPPHDFADLARILDMGADLGHTTALAALRQAIETIARRDARIAELERWEPRCPVCGECGPADGIHRCGGKRP